MPKKKFIPRRPLDKPKHRKALRLLAMSVCAKSDDHEQAFFWCVGSMNCAKFIGKDSFDHIGFNEYQTYANGKLKQQEFDEVFDVAEKCYKADA